MNHTIHSDELQPSSSLAVLNFGRTMREDTQRFLGRGLRLIRDPRQNLARLLTDLTFDTERETQSDKR